MTLSIIFYPYHFVRTILSMPFCPIPFCPYTILSIPFCPYHFVRYRFVLEPIKHMDQVFSSTESFTHNQQETIIRTSKRIPHLHLNFGVTCPESRSIIRQTNHLVFI